MYDYNHKPLTAHHQSVHAYSITVWGAEGPDEGTRVTAALLFWLCNLSWPASSTETLCCHMQQV